MSSSSKSVAQPRKPTCTRCRHHGIIVPRKGHVKLCPFLECSCWRCYLITQRTRITALHRSQGGGQHPPQDTEQHPCARTSEVRPKAEGTGSGSAPDGGAHQSATPTGILICQPSGGAAAAAGRPLDLRSRPAAVDDEGPASASSEEGSDAPDFTRFGPTAPPPVIHFPFRMPALCSSKFAPYPNFMFNMPWVPPVPAGLYNNALFGPQMFPHFQSSHLHYPPPPEPGPPADWGQIFFTLPSPPAPESYQEGLTQHPQPEEASDEVIELD
ncbi:uncharacterized protein [Pagrus major]|uniref:uncharacterized protein n=1 Tax=Pagrus major TaxID=143350 RepID=UPI003CC8A569